MDPDLVSIDRLSLKCYVPRPKCPETLLKGIYGFHKHQSTKRMRGTVPVEVHTAYDSPPKTPGGAYYSLEPLAALGSYIARVEWNPNHALWKLERVMAWLINQAGAPENEIWIDRFHIAFDWSIPRGHFTLEPAPRRTVKNFHKAGSTIETQELPVSRINPGWSLYDKEKERQYAREPVSGPWTRCELKFQPRPEDAPKLYNLHKYELPEKLGGKLMYMPDAREDFNLDERDCHFFALAREFAEFDPIRAKSRISDYAANRSIGAEIADSLMLAVDLDALWKDHRSAATARLHHHDP